MAIPLAFLMCSERSGSNFITALLNGHPEISGPPPSHLFRLFGLNHSRYEPLSDDRNWDAFRTDFLDAFEAMPGRWSSTVNPHLFDVGPPERSIAKVLQSVYLAECEADGARLVFVKENQLHTFLPFVLENWPGARFVHQIRDPRDVALSWLETGNMPGGIEKAICQWIADQSGSLDAQRQLIDPPNLLSVRYEDILADPHGAARRFCDFLGVEFRGEMLDFYRNGRTKDNASLYGAWNNLDKPVLSGNSFKFRKGLTPAEIEYVELRCADLMSEFGYALESAARDCPARERLERCKKIEPDVRLSKAHQYESVDDEVMRKRRKALIERVISRLPQAGGAVLAPGSNPTTGGAQDA